MIEKIAAKGNGGRPATGSIVWAEPETKTKPVGVRVTLAGGRRRLVRFDEGTTPEDAIALAPVLAERARFAVDENQSEAVAEYASRWCDWREERGILSAKADRTRILRHVVPLGHYPFATSHAMISGASYPRSIRKRSSAPTSLQTSGTRSAGRPR